MTVLTWESFIVECNRNNGIMVLLKALRKTVRHKMQQYSIMHIVFLYLFSKRVDTVIFSVESFCRKCTKIDI